ncbi:hypothetical protein LR48_Vigan04g152200 [Vigna angularis]|uniref:Uncharacterized protein n=1 Tax=Phaseolus angularis TaxID=3914 RepID=A0A0L9UFJ3_PHAAN|nr:hypothetical protein LR48_Vigan04g152200 [Vigna angularis]
MCQRIRIGVLHFLSSSSICRVHSSSFQDTNRSLLISQTIVPFNISFSLHTLLPLLINTVLSMGAAETSTVLSSFQPRHHAPPGRDNMLLLHEVNESSFSSSQAVTSGGCSCSMLRHHYWPSLFAAAAGPGRCWTCNCGRVLDVNELEREVQLLPLQAKMNFPILGGGWSSVLNLLLCAAALSFQHLDSTKIMLASFMGPSIGVLFKERKKIPFGMAVWYALLLSQLCFRVNE